MMKRNSVSLYLFVSCDTYAHYCLFTVGMKILEKAAEWKKALAMGGGMGGFTPSSSGTEGEQESQSALGKRSIHSISPANKEELDI